MEGGGGIRPLPPLGLRVSKKLGLDRVNPLSQVLFFHPFPLMRLGLYQHPSLISLIKYRLK